MTEQDPHPTKRTSFFGRFRPSSFMETRSEDEGDVLGNRGDDIHDQSHEDNSHEEHHHDHVEHVHNHTDQGHLYEPPPLEPVNLVGYNQAKTRLLGEELCEDIRQLLPMRNQLFGQWTLVYSLERNGASLRTLYDLVRISAEARPGGQARKSGFVLLVQDFDGNVFGAYANEAFRPSESKRFFGNGESFLWKTSHNHNHPGTTNFRAFPYSGVNNFVLFCTHDFLSMGGGDGHYGLWLDDNLDTGVSNRSLTFGNDPLSDSGSKFRIAALEVWALG